MGQAASEASTGRYPEESDTWVVAERGLPRIRPVRGQFGPYHLVCELASGGMGTVYVARIEHAAGIQRVVALKTIRSGLQEQPDFVRMFLDEARIISQVQHPYVCALSDVGHTDGTPYVAMEYLIGEPLSRVARLMAANAGDLSLSCIVRIIAGLAEGLHAVHEATDEEGRPLNIVHRDVSPENLFVLYDGSVRVMDFGVAHADDREQLTPAGTLKGKLAYMAPEQVRGHPADRRSDIWALGVVLWELITGAELFPRSPLHAAIAVLDAKIPMPSSINRYVPAALDRVIMKMLERNIDERYDTARHVAMDLEHVLSTCFGPVPSARLGMWLERLFPGSKDMRQRVVSHARRMMEESGPIAILSLGSQELLPERPSSQDMHTTPVRMGQRLQMAEPPALEVMDGLPSFIHPFAEPQAIPVVSAPSQPTQRRAWKGAVVVVSAACGALLSLLLPHLLQTPPVSMPIALAADTKLTLPALIPAVVSSVAPSPSEAPAAVPAQELGLAPQAEPAVMISAAAPQQALKAASAPPVRQPGAVRTQAKAKEAPAPAPVSASLDAPTPVLGRIYVRTPGAVAEVLYQGKVLGKTPTRVELPAGSHTLHLRRANDADLIPFDVDSHPGEFVMVDLGI